MREMTSREPRDRIAPSSRTRRQSILFFSFRGALLNDAERSPHRSVPRDSESYGYPEVRHFQNGVELGLPGPAEGSGWLAAALQRALKRKGVHPAALDRAYRTGRRADLALARNDILKISVAVLGCRYRLSSESREPGHRPGQSPSGRRFTRTAASFRVLNDVGGSVVFRSSA